MFSVDDLLTGWEVAFWVMATVWFMKTALHCWYIVNDDTIYQLYFGQEAPSI